MNRQQRRQAARLAKKARGPGRAATGGLALGNETAREMEAAVRFHQAGGFQNAAEIYRRILDRHPDHPDALHLLGLVAYQTGQCETAVDLIGRALAINPNFAEAHNSLGAALEAQGKPDDAVACYRRAVANKPDFVEAHNNLGNLLKDRGKRDEALAHFRRALDLNPNYAAAHSNLGNLMRDDGKLDEAVACYRRALTVNPNTAEAHNGLGTVLQDQGEPDAAVACYRRALASKPGYGEAHNNLGNMMKDEGNYGEALAHFRRAVDIDPGFAAAHNGLGVALKDQAKFDEATACHRRALDIDPNFAEAHYNLANLLKEQSKLDEAIAHYQRAVAIDPTSADGHNNFGFALQSGGRFDEAAAAYETALSVKPDYAISYKGLVALKKVRPDDDLIPRIERLLREETLSDGDRRHLNFALGKCFDDTGDFDEAFRHYRAANEIIKQRQPFDAAAFVEETDGIIATFTRRFLEERAMLGSESEQPVFIIGMPRSGTTLVEQILSSHAEVFGAGELPYFNLLAANLPTTLQDATAYPECAALIDEATAGRLAQGYLDRLRERSGDAARVTDKMPNNFRNLGLIALLLPRARIIHCRRDPLDVCLSCYFQDFVSQSFSHDLADIGRYYKQYERLMAHWRDCLAAPVLDVHYEELIADKEGVSRRMVAFCGLDWDDACLAFHKNDRQIHTASDWQARQPIYNTSVARWRRYEQHLGPLKQALEGAQGVARSAPSPSDLRKAG